MTLVDLHTYTDLHAFIDLHTETDNVYIENLWTIVESS